MPGSVTPPLSEPEVAGLVELARRIDHIQGWLSPREAWELHESARRAAQTRGADALVVEIGSWRGRSTVAIALGLRAGGGGRLISIDPHERADDRHAEVHRNLAEAGVAELVEVVRGYSHDARPLVPDAAADLVFIDGDHAYASVRQDLEDWQTAVRPGGVVGLNDPYWPGVRKLVEERIAVTGSPYRHPRLIVNTLFSEFRPAERWSEQDERVARALRSALRFIRRWRPPSELLKRRMPRSPLTWRFVRWYGSGIKRRYPLADLAHYDWAVHPPHEQSR